MHKIEYIIFVHIVLLIKFVVCVCDWYIKVSLCQRALNYKETEKIVKFIAGPHFQELP